MIDENGKIGGKVNLIDLLIVIVILAAVAFVGYRFILNDRTGIVNNEPVIVEFTCNEAFDTTVEQLELGAPVLDNYENIVLGNITDFKIGDPYSYSVTDSGDTVLSVVPIYRSVVLTIEGTGMLDGNGLVINSTRYGIGHTMTIFAGDCKIYGRISAIDPA